MKTKRRITLAFVLGLTLLVGLSTALQQATAQSSLGSFTYQGRLDDTSGPATGLFDIGFSLLNASTGGSTVAPVISKTSVPVTNGLFTVALEFTGVNIFDGTDRWLSLSVKRTGAAGASQVLAPRQQITAAPYAMRAREAATLPAGAVNTAMLADGAVMAGKLGAGAVTTDKIADGTIGAADVNAGSFNTTFWRATGNSGTAAGTQFLGTTDNQPLEIKANNRRALRLEPTADAANVIGGSAANFASNGVVGAVIAGGGDSAGFPNRVGASHSAIGGGLGNAAVGAQAVVGGGSRNSATAARAVVGGGLLNVSGGGGSVVGGGNQNAATGNFSTIGGGADNVASGQGAVIPGGINNTANATLAAAMGYRAKANHNGAFVWADSQEADFSSGSANQFLIRASGGVAIGTNDPAGAALRVAGAIRADSFLGTGTTLTLGTTDNQPLEFKVNGQRALRLEYARDSIFGFYSPNLVGGVPDNIVSNGFFGGVIGGGGDFNSPNRVGANYATVVGGLGNTASGIASTAMGARTTASGDASTAMGYETTASGSASTAMGYQTTASGYASTALGSGTSATDNDSTALGRLTLAGGSASMAAGYRAKALHNGSFVWADQQEADFASTAANQFAVRAAGGLHLSDDTSLSFGAQTRQMINLWNAEYGIGVQSSTTYFRSGLGFGWYKGGVHSHFYADPGPGGTALMFLDEFGRLGLGTTAPGYSLDIQQNQAVARFSTTGSANGSVLILNNASATRDYLGAINFESNGNTVGQIGYLANDRIVFTAGSAERMSVQAGLLTVNGVGNEQAYINGGGGVVQIGSRNPAVTAVRFANLTGTPNPWMDCFAKTFQAQSDRNAKQDFKRVEPASILEKVVALPITEWAYKGDTETRHVGPVAQDFKEAFGLGSSDKSIATVDADGVALAAIQGLNQKLEGEVTELRSENADLKQRLERLEKILSRNTQE